MKHTLKIISLILILSSCVVDNQSTIKAAKMNSTTSVDTTVGPETDALIPSNYVALNPAFATTVQVIKDGMGLCNSGAFSQLPDNKDYFVGRMLITSGSNLCDGTSWQLALFKMDWTNNILNFQKTIISPPAKVDALSMTITTAYDPYVIKYNNEYWVAFECHGAGSVFAATVSACLAPFTIASGIDLTRLSVPVKGVKLSSDTYSASVPKLLEFNGSLYMYWTAVHFKTFNGVDKFFDLATRGMQLVQELTTQRKIWGVRSGNIPVAAYDSLNTEVLGPNTTDPMSNNVADGFQVMVVDNKIIMPAAVGGTGCITPVSPVFGCYRLQIYRSSSPLGEHVFNSEVLNSPQLAFNPEEYSRIFYDPSGESFMMGMMIPPFLVGSPAPTNTVGTGYRRYPFDVKNLSFTTNIKSVNPVPNPQNNIEVVNLSIDVLENFIAGCNASSTHTINCRAAISRYCINQGHASGGYGPTDQNNGVVNITCIKENASKLLTTTLASLKKIQSRCSGLASDFCNSAINQYCNANGYAGGGFGPSEFDGTNVKLVCLKAPRGYSLHTTLSHMKTFHSACSDSDVNSIACNSAVNKFCATAGYKSTFGILEHVADALLVGCLN